MAVFTTITKSASPEWDTPYKNGRTWAQMTQQWEDTEETWGELGTTAWTLVTQS